MDNDYVPDIFDCIKAINLEHFSKKFRNSNYNTNVVLASVLYALAKKCRLRGNEKMKKNDAGILTNEEDPYSWRYQKWIYGESFNKGPILTESDLEMQTVFEAHGLRYYHFYMVLDFF